MQVIVPATLTLSSTTVAASSYPEWASGTAYAAGDRVVVTTAVPHHEYEAAQANTNKPPATNLTTYWIDLGVTNQYRLLDDRTTTQSTETDGFEVVVAVPSRVSHLAVFRASTCESVRIRQVVDTVQVLDVTYPMRSFSPAGTWSEYLFSPSEYRENLVVPIPGWYSGSVITATFNGSTGLTVGIGHLVVGLATILGRTVLPLRYGIVDFSTKEADEWGETLLVERAYADRIAGQCLIDAARRDTVRRLMAGRRAKGSVWDCNDDGSNVDAWRLFGFCKEFELAEEDDIPMSFELEGLT